MEKLTNRRTKENCLLFRQIQVMLVEFRRLYSSKIVSAAAVGIVILQITMAYLWIDLCRQGKAQEQALIVGIGIFVSIEIATISTFLFGNLGKVYAAATASKEEIRANKVAMMRKEYRKFAKACPVLKIYLGDQNYLEPSTSLVFEEFVLDNLIGLLVI